MSHDDRPIILGMWVWVCFILAAYTIYHGHYLVTAGIAAFAYWLLKP